MGAAPANDIHPNVGHTVTRPCQQVATTMNLYTLLCSVFSVVGIVNLFKRTFKVRDIEFRAPHHHLESNPKP